MLPRWKSVSPRPTAAEWAAVVKTARRRVADFSAARWRDWSRVRKSPELWLGLKQGVLVGAAAATLFLPPAGLARLPSSEATRFVVPAGESLVSATPAVLEAAAPRAADFQDVEPAAAVRDLANWVAASNDNLAGHQRLPFAVLDKLGARVYVFDAQAQLIGASLVLLGSASGDDTPPGVGDKKLSEILSHERITPAGRFVSEPGRDDVGNDVVWVDYDSALAMHRVQVIDPAEKRFESSNPRWAAPARSSTSSPRSSGSTRSSRRRGHAPSRCTKGSRPRLCNASPVPATGLCPAVPPHA